MSDSFDFSAKCTKKLVQTQSKEGREKCVHRAGEQLPTQCDCLRREMHGRTGEP